MKRLKYKDWNCVVQKEQYRNGGTAISLYDEEDGAPVMTASLWVEGLEEDEIAIKNYSENEGILPILIEEGVVTKPHRKISSGFVTVPVCKLII